MIESGSIWLIALFPLGYSLLSISVRLVETKTWIQAEAFVTQLGRGRRVSDDSRIDSTMVPRIRFLTQQGEEIEIEDKELRFGPVVPGQTIRVLYSPNNPTRCVPQPWRRRFRFEFSLGLFAIGLVLVFSI